MDDDVEVDCWHCGSSFWWQQADFPKSPDLHVTHNGWKVDVVCPHCTIFNSEPTLERALAVRAERAWVDKQPIPTQARLSEKCPICAGSLADDSYTCGPAHTLLLRYYARAHDDRLRIEDLIEQRDKFHQDAVAVHEKSVGLTESLRSAVTLLDNIRSLLK